MSTIQRTHKYTPYSACHTPRPLRSTPHTTHASPTHHGGHTQPVPHTTCHTHHAAHHIPRRLNHHTYTAPLTIHYTRYALSSPSLLRARHNTLAAHRIPPPELCRRVTIATHHISSLPTMHTHHFQPSQSTYSRLPCSPYPHHTILTMYNTHTQSCSGKGEMGMKWVDKGTNGWEYRFPYTQLTRLLRPYTRNTLPITHDRQPFSISRRIQPFI